MARFSDADLLDSNDHWSRRGFTAEYLCDDPEFKSVIRLVWGGKRLKYHLAAIVRIKHHEAVPRTLVTVEFTKGGLEFFADVAEGSSRLNELRKRYPDGQERYKVLAGILAGSLCREGEKGREKDVWDWAKAIHKTGIVIDGGQIIFILPYYWTPFTGVELYGPAYNMKRLAEPSRRGFFHSAT